MTKAEELAQWIENSALEHSKNPLIAAELRRLEAENVELRKDAERYRFFRAERYAQTASGLMLGVDDEDGTILHYELLDEAIDACLAALKETP